VARIAFAGLGVRLVPRRLSYRPKSNWKLSTIGIASASNASKSAAWAESTMIRSLPPPGISRKTKRPR
jgi:hypothetical protein